MIPLPVSMRAVQIESRCVWSFFSTNPDGVANFKQ